MIPGLDILARANKEYPTTRIVWPAIAIVAAVAVIESFKLGWGVAATGAIGVVILLLLFFLVAGIVKILDDDSQRREILKYPITVIVWVFTLCLCVVLGLVISSFFFGYPKTTAQLFTFGTDVVAEQQKPAQSPPTVQPLSPTAQPQANEQIARQTPPDRARVSQCLDNIDKSKYSTIEVDRLARQCLQPQ
jgi:hypothetical protein